MSFLTAIFQFKFNLFPQIPYCLAFCPFVVFASPSPPQAIPRCTWPLLRAGPIFMVMINGCRCPTACPPPPRRKCLMQLASPQQCQFGDIPLGLRGFRWRRLWVVAFQRDWDQNGAVAEEDDQKGEEIDLKMGDESVLG
jgi:hypothetical protein